MDAQRSQPFNGLAVNWPVWPATRSRPSPSVAFCLGLSALAVVGGGLFFHDLGRRGVWSAHEGRAGQNAQTILDDGCWGLPRLFDGHPELQKPPMYYWLVAASAWLRGGRVEAWDIRVPAALAGWLGVVGLALLGWRLGRPVAGLAAASTLASMVHYTWLARVGRIDMPLTLVVGVTIAAGYLGQWTRDDRWLILAFVAVAAAIMLKGPIGAVLPGVVLAAVALAERRPIFGRSLLWGVPLVLALVLPWYVWVGLQTEGAFYRVFVWYHNVERGLLPSEGLAARPWWFYGPRLLVDMLPWSPLLVAAGWYWFRCGRWRDDALARLGFVWMVSVVAFLSLMRFKRADYLLPAYPGAALWMGSTLEAWSRASRRPAGWVWGVAVVLVGALLGWQVYEGHILPQREPLRDQRPFAEAIRRLAPAPTEILFFRAEAHDLAFYLGRRQNTFLEWENLDVWAGRPGRYYIVMPPACAAEWGRHVASGRLVEVLRNTDLAGGRHERPLVLMRTEPHRREQP
ncbi:MAG: glycosyltransferase family 39 protein [Gemmataceae bacterium]|nr:glycosyltransferase family 39 protein [Gemmataceae bacterium]MDW8267239.1 glycosyltransferase family 39 protein [Gemmataceae bacterium]